MLEKNLFSIIVYYRILNIVPNRTLLFIHSIHNILHLLVSAVQSLSRVWLFATPGTAACQASLSITNSWSLLNSCPLSQWCHTTISSSVTPFSSCLQSSPASGSLTMSQFFASGGQNIGVSASTSVLPMNFQDWFPLGWTGWISLQSRGLSRVFSNTRVQSINSLVLSFLYSPTLTFIHDYWKKKSFASQTFTGKLMSLLFNVLSMFVITFLPTCKHLLISWLQSPSAVILEPQK